MDYFLSIAGERSGPFTQFQLIQRIREGSLLGPELAWHKGAADWLPLKKLEEFSSYWPLTAEQIARADEARRLARVSLDTPQPWLRFWARMLDYVWFLIVLGFVLYVILPQQQELLLVNPKDQPLWMTVLANLWMMLFVPLEAWCLSRYGTTPGKSLLRIQVCTAEGARPTFRQALVRSFLVYVKGMGLGIYVVPLFTMSYGRMVLMQTGKTTWDRACGTRVEHGEPEMWRFLVVVAIMMAIAFFLTVGLLLMSHQMMDALRSGLPK